MVADYRYHRLDSVRDHLSLMVYPIQWVADAPFRLAVNIHDYTRTYRQLFKEHEDLKKQQLLENVQLQKLMALEAENVRLRVLLQSSARPVAKNLQAAEIIRVSSDSFVHRVVLNKGAKDQIKPGYPVMDAHGILGEVVEVYPSTSRVILLSDSSYGISVENVRTGIRGIAAGTGTTRKLELRHVANTVDLQIGDQLLSSGLDGRYPAGYPVGVVSRIFADPAEPFVNVEITPNAHLDRSRHVLLLPHLGKTE